MRAATTSIDSFHKLIRSGELSAKCIELATIYYRHGVLADFEAAPLLGWHQSQVSARRGDMMDKDEQGRCKGTGKVIEYGTTINTFTNREVNRYKLNLGDQPTLT